MDKIDRLGWAAGISFVSYGLRIGIRVSNPEVLNRLPDVLPPPLEACSLAQSGALVFACGRRGRAARQHSPLQRAVRRRGETGSDDGTRADARGFGVRPAALCRGEGSPEIVCSCRRCRVARTRNYCPWELRIAWPESHSSPTGYGLESG